MSDPKLIKKMIPPTPSHLTKIKGEEAGTVVHSSQEPQSSLGAQSR
jgi:hypothetical protein